LLALAHRRGVIHRDIKPANILRDDEGNAYLADFGIARPVAPVNSVPSDEPRAFSPGYAAPEEILAAPITPQTDIYSLAVCRREKDRGA
jgi:serine/threonine protein kinase